MIGSVKRIQAKGWGNALLNETFKELGYQASQRKFMARELQLVSVAFTQIIAHHLVKDDFRQSLAGIHVDKTSEALSPTNFLYPVDTERLIKIFKFLFDNPGISQEDVNTFLTSTLRRPWTTVFRPRPLLKQFHEWRVNSPTIIFRGRGNIFCRSASVQRILDSFGSYRKPEGAQGSGVLWCVCK